MSMCMFENLASGVLNLPSGDAVWRCTFDFWHYRQHLAQLRTSWLMFGQTYLAVIRRWVARILGCESECKESKTVFLNCCGT